MKTTKLYCLLATLTLVLLIFSGCSGNETVTPANSSSPTEIKLELESSQPNNSSSGSDSRDTNNVTSTSDISNAGDIPTTSKGSDNTSGNSSAGNAGGSGSSIGNDGKPNPGTTSKSSDSDNGQGSSPSSVSPSSKPDKDKPVQPSEPPPVEPPAPPDPPAPSIPDDLNPYVYPFDVVKIKSDLMKYGEGLGMTHRTHNPDGVLRTPANCSWWSPYPLSANCTSPEVTRRQLYEMIAFEKEDQNLKNFTIYIEGDNGTYNVYMMH